MRATVIPQALNGQPFRTAEAYALGVSLKTLQGGRFRRITKGVYVAATTADSHRIHVRGVLLVSPPGTIATGVTGLQLLGVDVGPRLPMTFATTHPWQVRRRDMKVMRLKELPSHRDGIAAPEHCWLIAASCFESARPRCGLRFADPETAHHARSAPGGSTGIFGSRRCCCACRRALGARTGGFTTRDLAATLPCSRRSADAGMQRDHRR